MALGQKIRGKLLVPIDQEIEDLCIELSMIVKNPKSQKGCENNSVIYQKYSINNHMQRDKVRINDEHPREHQHKNIFNVIRYIQFP